MGKENYFEYFEKNFKFFDKKQQNKNIIFEQWFSTRGDLVASLSLSKIRGHLAMSWTIFCCYNWWIKDRNATKHPAIHRTAPKRKNCGPKMSITPKSRNLLKRLSEIWIPNINAALHINVYSMQMHQGLRLGRRETTLVVWLLQLCHKSFVDLSVWASHYQNCQVEEACICPSLFYLLPFLRSLAHQRLLLLQSLLGDAVTSPCLDAVLSSS